MRTGLALLGFTLLATMFVSEKAATIVVNFLFAGVIPGSDARVEPLFIFFVVGLMLGAIILLRSLYHYLKTKTTKKHSTQLRRFTRLQA